MYLGVGILPKYVFRGVCLNMQTPPPVVDRMTDARKNITVTRFATRAAIILYVQTKCVA